MSDSPVTVTMNTSPSPSMRHQSRRDELSSESGFLSGDLDAGIDAEAMGPLALPFRGDIVKQCHGNAA